tara:strand:+ start:187 stop:612 length:426 start_codon:yes stop_codon:yes gene_type:complete
MATTATISISSDIAPGFGGISKSMTLTKAGTVTDIDSTTGFQIRKLNSASATDLITMTSEIVEPKDSTAAKIYIRNIGDGKGNIDKSVGVTIGIKSEPIGKLYGGDWLMMPLTVIDADDVTATPENNNTVVLEYIMFYEEA